MAAPMRPVTIVHGCSIIRGDLQGEKIWLVPSDSLEDRCGKNFIKLAKDKRMLIEFK